MASAIAIDYGRLTRELGIDQDKIARTVALLDEGNTVPFITRYRRDQTGGLDEEQIGRIRDGITKIRLLDERRQTILRSIESQHALTDELRKLIEQADSVKRLEDLYLPYRPKKQTLATKAHEQGLAPLAKEIHEQDKAAADLDKRAADFINTDKGIPDAATALLGAGHILAEQFSEDPELRQKVRKLFRKSGKLASAKVEDNPKKNQQFHDYLDFREPLTRVPPHRVLAINRGERAKVLNVKVEADTPAIEELGIEQLVPPDHAHKDFLTGCVRDALTRLILPSLEREARRELTEKAETHAVEVFARNLRNLLLQPPLPGRRILAVDPGYKNGCKLAALDEFGKLLAHDVIYVVGSDEQKTAGRAKLVAFITEHNLSVIAIGNGTACRQTEQLIAEILGTELADQDVHYVVVNEAGASVYSTSEVGREEFPECDAIQRSAISIGRRLQDPLSELVKIDPASIGVGLYQHDARAKHLRDSLDDVVQSCVSFVGVELNSASTPLLRYVSGMNQLTARRVYEHRTQNGPFKNRQQLMEVSGLGNATFVQAAGFLKIVGGDQPLDATWIHPENYEAAKKLLEKLGIDSATVAGGSSATQIREAVTPLDRAALATELGIGQLALDDMIEALCRPGRDPREDLPPPIFRKDVVKFEDLQAGMELRGTVLNVVDFGAFVDVGLSDSGLIHISQLSSGYVRDPHQVVAVGDQVRAWVASIDQERRRVALTMIAPGTERPKPEKSRGRGRGQRQDGPQQPQPQGHGSMGDILALIMEKRGSCDHTDTLDQNRVMLKCTLPLNEILVDFNDRLKSVTHGYGSMDYELGAYRVSDLVKMDIMINGEPVDAFSSIVHREKAENKGRELCEKLAEIIPPQMFKVAIQAAIGGKIIARDNVREMRKDVTAKCYGGDITRKRKLLDKQKEGKKKMNKIGRVSIPPDAFIKVLQNN